MTNHIPPAPPLPERAAVDPNRPAWAWWSNGAAAAALAALTLALGWRVVRYIDTADDHLDYEALGFAQLFGVFGLILLTPILLVALIAAICAGFRRRAAFVLNIAGGLMALSVAGGLTSHRYVAIIPAASIIVATAGWIAVGPPRRFP